MPRRLRRAEGAVHGAEVSVAPSHCGRGLGKAVVSALLQHGRELGCAQAWVLTDRPNSAATRLYADCGGNDAGDQVMFDFDLRE